MKDHSERISQLFTRGVAQVVERDHLAQVLRSGKKLRVKFGIDPTAPDLHLGHAVVLRKLKEFQDLGHKVVLIIGDFTARIGDPSGKSKTRPVLTEREIRKNMRDYLKHAALVLDVKKLEVRYNSEWLGKLDAKKIMELLSMISVQQILERDDFSKRLSAHESIRAHELLYPVMQAYDSVVVKADVECGGTDQTFNLLAGRDLMSKMGLKSQDILTVEILEGLDGVKKMSKSLGNYVGLNEKPDDMFGKIMRMPDSLMVRYFALCTDVSEDETRQLQATLSPRNLKARLAFEIVKTYRGEKEAQRADERFTKLFSKKEIVSDIPALPIAGEQLHMTDIPLRAGLAKSNSEARRLIEQGGLKIDDVVVGDSRATTILKKGQVVKIGKRHFFRVG